MSDTEMQDDAVPSPIKSTKPSKRTDDSNNTGTSITSSSDTAALAADDTQRHKTTLVNGTDSLPWVEKYRPSNLTQLISHQDIINTISKMMKANKLPHLLFYGPPGTGKTSTILAIARELNGPRYQSMILELNASDDRGIDVVREQIKDFASSKKLFSTGLKLIILDEADQMTKQAQFALRRIIEKYTRNVRFCIICNYVNKIIPALQSRCMRFRFGPLERSQVEEKLRDVAQREGVNVTDNGLSAIIRLAEGDMRKCLNVLQSCHMAYDVVNEENVYASTGQPLPSDINKILDLLLNSNAADAHREIQQLQTLKGLSLVDIVERLHELALRITFPPPVLEFTLEKLADVEYRLALGSSEKLQLGSLIGTFQIAAHRSTEWKPEDDPLTAQQQKQQSSAQTLSLATSDYDYD